MLGNYFLTKSFFFNPSYYIFVCKKTNPKITGNKYSPIIIHIVEACRGRLTNLGFTIFVDRLESLVIIMEKRFILGLINNFCVVLHHIWDGFSA